MIKNIHHETTWIEISESTYAQNLRFFRKLIGEKTELSAVVKANGYGHGWQQIAELAIKYGADSFCVHSLPEAIKLRDAGFQKDILVMGPVPLESLHEVADRKLRLVIFNRETLEKLAEISAATGKSINIHLKLETGTYRQGIAREELPWFLEKITQAPGITLEAVYTHFANIEDTTTHSFAEKQQTLFRQLFEDIRDNGYPHLKRHAACTAAALLFEDTYFDMIRLGIGQYGFWPSRETLVSYKMQHGKNAEKSLLPVLTWKTRVTQLKEVPAESTIGYGRTFKTTRRSRIAILPVGYSDGYDRGLSNQGFVLIRGKQAPVRGRICMNLMMVDVTDIPEVKLFDEAVLIGRQGAEEISADQLAAMCGTIHYEVVSRINREIPRAIVR